MNRLKSLIQEKALQRGTFYLASGKTSNYYIDLRKMMLNSRDLMVIGDTLADFILDNFKCDKNFVVGGTGLGGTILVSTILHNLFDVKACIVRESRKQHGLMSLVEGELCKDDQILFVEDVTTTGGSVWAAINTVKKYLWEKSLSTKILGVVTIVDRQAGARELFNQNNIPFHSLFTIDELLR